MPGFHKVCMGRGLCSSFGTDGHVTELQNFGPN